MSDAGQTGQGYPPPGYPVAPQGYPSAPPPVAAPPAAPQPAAAPPAAPQPVAAPPRPAEPLGAPGEPTTIGELAKLVGRALFKSLPLQIAIALVMFGLVWLIHTYLVVVPNEGFNVGSVSWWPPTPDNLRSYTLGQTLALSGRLMSGTAFWFALMSLTFAVITGIFTRKGEFFTGLGQIPARVRSGLAGGNPSIGTAALGAGVALLIIAYLSNRILATTTMALMLLALGEPAGGFHALIIRCFYNDGRKVISKPARRLPDERAYGLLTGVVAGLFAYLIMLPLPDFLFMGSGVILVVVGIILLNQEGGGQQMAGATASLLLGLLALGIARVAFGDDGGIAESGGTWEQWIQSEGAGTAVVMGVPPAIGAVTGAMTGVVSGVINSWTPTLVTGASGAGSPHYTYPVLTGDPAADAMSTYATSMSNLGEAIEHGVLDEPATPEPSPPVDPWATPDVVPEPGVEGGTPELPPEPPEPPPLEPTPIPHYDENGNLMPPYEPDLIGEGWDTLKDFFTGDGTEGSLVPDLGPDLGGAADALKDWLGASVDAGSQAADTMGEVMPEIVESDAYGIFSSAMGTINTLTGSASEFIHLDDAPETLDSIRDAMKAWHGAPSAETGEAYVKAIGQTSDLRLGKIAGVLDTFGKGLDIFDAVGKGLGKADAAGFTGVDKALTVGGELGKKFLVWQATKNPVVGLLDWGVGTTTEAIWGPEGRIDISAGLEKTVDVVGEHVKDLSTEAGDLAGGGAEADAASQTADQFRHSLRRIKDQIASGKITREEGIARAHRLNDIMNAGVE